METPNRFKRKGSVTQQADSCLLC